MPCWRCMDLRSGDGTTREKRRLRVLRGVRVGGSSPTGLRRRSGPPALRASGSGTRRPGPPLARQLGGATRRSLSLVVSYRLVGCADATPPTMLRAR